MRSFACAFVLVMASGCSLLFRGDNYQGTRPGDGGADSGSDARPVTDAAPDASPACQSITATCDDDESVFTCDDSGEERARQACAMGCDHGICKAVKPKFVNESNLVAAGTVDVVIEDGEEATWDVNTGILDHGASNETIAPQVETQGAATGIPKLSVIAVRSLTVESGGVLRLTGGNAVALLAQGVIRIDGVLDASGADANGGPGGMSSTAENPVDPTRPKISGRPGAQFSMETPFTQKDGETAAAGGGGGSNGSAGAPGGNAKAQHSTLEATSAAGGLAGDLASSWATSALVGGGAGGSTGNGRPQFSSWIPGGGGGGALLLASSVRVELGVTGIIDAAGAGGPSRTSSVLASRNARVGGAGGGAGGTVVIEAPVVEVNGGVFANGGGGSGGDAARLTDSDVGQNGLRSAIRANGSPGASEDFGCVGAAGGKGAVGDDDNRVASAGAPADAAGVGCAANLFNQHVFGSGGGGGGGAGRIEIHTLNGNAPTGSGTFSPSDTALLTYGEIETFYPAAP